jgi:hypothetical protein
MLAWLRRIVSGTPDAHEHAERERPQGLGMSKEYVSLHKYLDGRYADVVVLTFAEIEDLLGFTLPQSARRDRGWWGNESLGNAEHSNAWLLARRTATPNLASQRVVFERGHASAVR